MDQFSLNSDLEKLAFDEFGETIELRTTSLNNLRDKIALLDNPEDKIKDTSDENLIRFLRARKYDMDRVLEATVKFQHFYNKYGDVLKDITKDEIAHIKEFIEVYREPGCGRVFAIMRPSLGIKKFTKELLKANPRFMLRVNIWIFDTLSKDPQVQIGGLVIVNTFQNFTFWDNIAMSSMAPMEDQLATFQYFQILGTRFKGAYIFEEPSFMSWIWFFVKPFMSEKIRTRFFLCGNNYDILKSVIEDMSILPTYLGGSITPDLYPNWVEQQLELM